MHRRITTALTALALCFTVCQFTLADITNYSQDFEGLDMADPDALANDGWLVGANVFDPSGTTFLYNYFAFPAPNGGPAFSAITTGEGGPPQGNQQLVTYNDYNNMDHNIGNQIEANFFREYTITSSDVGSRFTFTFDAKLGDLMPPTTASAFIKTIDPDNGFALTNFVTQQTDNIPTTWSTYSLSLDIDSSLEGQLFQIGFLNTAANFTPSGVVYDNISLVPEPGSATLIAAALLGLITRRRR